MSRYNEWLDELYADTLPKLRITKLCDDAAFKTFLKALYFADFGVDEARKLIQDLFALATFPAEDLCSLLRRMSCEERINARVSETIHRIDVERGN